MINFLDICASCADTGFTTEPQCDYPGNDMWSLHGQQDSFEDCISHCEKYDTCLAATWNKATGNCFPKSAIGQRDECKNPNNTVGRRCHLVEECPKGIIH